MATGIERERERERDSTVVTLYIYICMYVSVIVIIISSSIIYIYIYAVCFLKLYVVGEIVAESPYAALLIGIFRGPLFRAPLVISLSILVAQ